jgi:GNAT superfamily N-acetyltransferase
LSSSVYEQVRKLAGSDAVESFDCGQPALNQFLQRFALVSQKSNSAMTYVSCHSSLVVGFYRLAVCSVEPTAAGPRVIKGIPQHPVPVMILVRLGVDLQHQGAGLGKALLKDALLRTAQAANIAGIRALLVHAMDETTRQWYLNWEFEPSLSDPFHLFLLMKDIKAMVASG